MPRDFLDVVHLEQLLRAAKAAADALAEAEHTIESEWGRVMPRAEWEATEGMQGPSPTLRNLRDAIKRAEGCPDV